MPAANSLQLESQNSANRPRKSSSTANLHAAELRTTPKPASPAQALAVTAEASLGEKASSKSTSPAGPLGPATSASPDKLASTSPSKAARKSPDGPLPETAAKRQRLDLGKSFSATLATDIQTSPG